MRHTKIIATVGPASDSAERLESLIAAGVNVFRLNFSHGTHAGHAQVFARIRDAAKRAKRHVAVMQDLSGPKIRTGPLPAGTSLTLSEGDELRIGIGDRQGQPGRVFTPYAELIESARAGDRLLLDDGRIELRVEGNEPDTLVTRVVHGGSLGGHKGINAPGVALPASALTGKDYEDLTFGMSLGVDLVALSFVQTAEDVEKARAAMGGGDRQVPIIAKIERPAAVANLPAILDAAQGVMVARGDLGLELPLEQLPRVQKEIVRLARQRGKTVIVATQVLESMRSEPRPTRAEVSDAATAVDEGVDAIMLAGETAVGAFPVRAVSTLDAVIRDAETVPAVYQLSPEVDTTGSVHGRALCEAAVTLATTGKADAIVAVTREGKTARMLSALRPATPIYATAASDGLAAALELCWGVTPVVTDETSVDALESLLIRGGLLRSGAVVVYVSVSPELDRSDSNFLNIQCIG